MIGTWIGSLGAFGGWIVLLVVVGTLGLALVGVLLGRNVSLGFRSMTTLNITVPEVPPQRSVTGEHPPGLGGRPDQKPKVRPPGKKRKESA